MRRMLLFLVYFVSYCFGEPEMNASSRTFDLNQEIPEEARGFLTEFLRPVSGVFEGMFGGTKVIKDTDYITTTPRPWFSYPSFKPEDTKYDEYSSSEEDEENNDGQSGNTSSNDSNDSSEETSDDVKPNTGFIQQGVKKGQKRPQSANQQAIHISPINSDKSSESYSSEENIFEEMETFVESAVVGIADSLDSSEEEYEDQKDTKITTSTTTTTTTTTTTEPPYEWHFIRRRKPQPQTHLPSLADFTSTEALENPVLPIPNFPSTPITYNYQNSNRFPNFPNTANFPNGQHRFPVQQGFPVTNNRPKTQRPPYNFPGTQQRYPIFQVGQRFPNFQTAHVKVPLIVQSHKSGQQSLLVKAQNYSIDQSMVTNDEESVTEKPVQATFALPVRVNKVVLRQKPFRGQFVGEKDFIEGNIENTSTGQMDVLNFLPFITEDQTESQLLRNNKPKNNTRKISRGKQKIKHGLRQRSLKQLPKNNVAIKDMVKSDQRKINENANNTDLGSFSPETSTHATNISNFDSHLLLKQNGETYNKSEGEPTIIFDKLLFENDSLAEEKQIENESMSSVLNESKIRNIRSVKRGGRQFGFWFSEDEEKNSNGDEPGWFDSFYDWSRILMPSYNDLIIPSWLYNLFFNRERKPMQTTAIHTTEASITSTEPSWFESMDLLKPMSSLIMGSQNPVTKPIDPILEPLLVPSVSGKRKSYSGYQLLQFLPNGYYNLETLLDLHDASQGTELQWWTGPPKMGVPSDVLVPPEILENLKRHLKNERVEYEIRVRDMQRALSNENPKMTKRQRSALIDARGHPMTWTRYHRYADIERYLQYLALRYPKLVTLHTIGRSYEGRVLLVAKVSLPKNSTFIHHEDSKSKSEKKRKLTDYDYDFEEKFDGFDNFDSNFLRKRRDDFYKTIRRKFRSKLRHSRINSRTNSRGYSINDSWNMKSNTKAKRKRKPGIWIDGGWHGREWIAPSVVTWFLKMLVEGDEENGSCITRDEAMLEAADWFIMPLANPDGYEYTHTDDRFWKKTRSQPDLGITEITWNIDKYINWNFFPWLKPAASSQKCTGADPDRNWGHRWERMSTSNFGLRPCASDYYSGTKPFSEPETRAVAEFIVAQKRKIKVFLSMHAYSQLWAVPDSDPMTSSQDASDSLRLAGAALRALEKVQGTQYKAGKTGDLMYPMTGTAAEWAKAIGRVRYSYTVYLPDTGRYGYLLPPQQIISTATETWAGIKALVTNL